MGMIQAGMSQSQVAKNVGAPSELCRRSGINFRPAGPWLIGPLWESGQLFSGGQARDEEDGWEKGVNR